MLPRTLSFICRAFVVRGLLLGLILSAATLSKAAPALVWSDEFNQVDGSGPDDTKWGYDLGGGGWGNNELETYTNSRNNSFITSDPDAVDGKALVIRAIAANGGYTSARLLTNGKFATKYGRLEARLKMPKGKGLWPAFWALGSNLGTVGWPACGEIDVMEWVGQTPDHIKSSLHLPGYSGGNPLNADYVLTGGATYSDAYHIFAVDWYPGVLIFSMDGNVFEVRKKSDLPAGTAWPFEQNFFMILNFAVGGGWPGNPDANTKFPQDYKIDYVRVYSLPATPPPGNAWAPAASQGVGALALSSSLVRVTWLPPATGFGAAVTGYTLERATDSAFTQNLVTHDVGLATAYDDSTVVSGASYYYRVVATSMNGGSDPQPSVRVDVPASVAADASSLINISTRAYVGVGSSVSIAGFYIKGAGGKHVIVRAIGPTLAAFSVTGTLPDPVVSVYDAAKNLVAVNDNWGQAADAADLPGLFTSVGAFQLVAGSKDAALDVVLPEGAYTAVVSGANGTSGVALVEAYEAH